MYTAKSGVRNILKSKKIQMVGLLANFSLHYFLDYVINHHYLGAVDVF